MSFFAAWFVLKIYIFCLMFEMNKNVLIFLPDCLDINKTGYLTGLHKRFHDCETFYITNDNVLKNYNTNCTGFIGRSRKSIPNSNFLHLVKINNSLSVANDSLASEFVIINYDYDGFQKSNILDFETIYGRHFEILSSILKARKTSNGKQAFWKTIACMIIYLLNILSMIISKLEHLCKHSATFQHFNETVVSVRILFQGLCSHGFGPMLSNKLSAKLIDMILGILALNYFLTYENYIVEAIHTLFKEIIFNLKNLLLYLTGSPIGLKLNHAFNKSLGQFFFYHISLWRLFLLNLQPLFKTYFRYFVLPGTLGLSFQIAMVLDVISLATFHVFCIYVYAARMFNLQLKGLVSLWRLFLGKKYNPLRNRVDSCQYSPNQLFVGTLGFTVLLFLLPTTIMYYTVFSMFRLVILTVNGILLKSIFLLKAIPLYTLMLWIKRSPSLAGALYMVCSNSQDDNVTRVNVKLDILPLLQCLRASMPVKHDNQKSVGNIFHSLFTGVLL